MDQSQSGGCGSELSDLYNVYRCDCLYGTAGGNDNRKIRSYALYFSGDISSPDCGKLCHSRRISFHAGTGICQHC